MARMFARHPVSDFEKWHAAYKEAASFQQENGVIAQSVHQNAEDPNDVTVVHDFSSLEDAKAFVSNEDLKSLMQDAGVSGPPTIWITT